MIISVELANGRTHEPATVASIMTELGLLKASDPYTYTMIVETALNPNSHAIIGNRDQFGFLVDRKLRLLPVVVDVIKASINKFDRDQRMMNPFQDLTVALE